jgi:o-succinylbenzoate---CoA ligase
VNRRLRDVPARPELLLEALVGALDGTGPAITPAPAQAAEVPAEVSLVVRTSGSTGASRDVMLDADALHASADATAARLSGHGQWLLTLPPEHVAGLQVLVRSVIAGTTPVIARPGPFRAAGFVADAARLGDGPRYTSLVPTQLVRLLDDPEATAALAGFDAVLLGGAATPARVLDAARAAGVRVVTTYGMTETCGGCVYDGVPLDGVEVTVDGGLVHISGPVLARGYLGRPDLDERSFVTADGVRRLRTSDLGRMHDGRLTILGRADDVIVTGGVKVAPAAVEAALAGLPGIADVCVVGVPDAEWGQSVVAAVVVSGDAPTLAQVRAAVTGRLDAAHAPRHLVVLDSLPLRGPGKHDRRALATMLTDILAAPSDRRIPT